MCAFTRTNHLGLPVRGEPSPEVLAFEGDNRQEMVFARFRGESVCDFEHTLASYRSQLAGAEIDIPRKVQKQRLKFLEAWFKAACDDDDDEPFFSSWSILVDRFGTGGMSRQLREIRRDHVSPSTSQARLTPTGRHSPADHRKRSARCAYTARRPIASPPSGRPGRERMFQPMMSKCAHGIDSPTNRSRNSAAVIAPP